MEVGQLVQVEEYNRKTIQDCIDKMQYENQATILHNGAIMGFEEEKDD